MFTFQNIEAGETVHQRCVLLYGHYDGPSAQDHSNFIRVQTKDEVDEEVFPEQRWLLSHGWFKALVMLSPGDNKLVFYVGNEDQEATVLHIQYVPLLQSPPLHLAILIAKDSPLLIDCSDKKFGALCGAHSSLEAAIAKFRMTAYQWQALTAAAMFDNGLRRRSFRLEEEWCADTVSQTYLRSVCADSTAKVHLVRTDKTVAELRNIEFAQQNSRAQNPNELHEIFKQALLQHGFPFVSDTRPVVAGLILDTAYDTSRRMILGHAALGAHDPAGLSLGIFGSHLTYSWPRSIEEVTSCLMDTRMPGPLVGNDNGECASLWEACSVGQGAFLHEVGHAFSAPHTTGIMMRGYAKDWPKCFLSETARNMQTGAPGVAPVTPETSHDCRWDIRDLLRFVNLPHFRLPGDTRLPQSNPTIVLSDSEDEKKQRVVVSCPAGIAMVLFNGDAKETPSVAHPETMTSYNIDDLERTYDLSQPLMLEVIAMNGKAAVTDLAKLLSASSKLRIPGTSIMLRKKSVQSYDARDDDWHWAVMLKKRAEDGHLTSAYKIDIRVGAALDGAIVYYKDGTKIPCGPRGKNGDDPHMGGHQARKLALPKKVDIVKVQVQAAAGSYLGGLRMTLSNGRAMGALNLGGSSALAEVLVPDEGQRILGFYGRSGAYGMCSEFGIVTGPKDKDIPDSVYDMPELQNYPLGHKRKGRKHGTIGKLDESDTDETLDTSEDEDDGYDYEEDFDSEDE
ncbi:putative peptidase family-domain-containing protein [Stachybotrys elegans]|uniref:Peptidase family-domain-containing protein n=1 Tax=Stachybotrys elegans TaxID=80388 RepID=A0A8K0SWM9_9HYPO|nr:putative peptidase family-domain-containing protein [Stachybotrys elegans]